MTLALSLVAGVILVGHAVAIARFKSLWPFDHYPMYSTPVARLKYPLVRDKQLTMYSLLEVKADGTTEDLLSQANIYPEVFHPLDRVEIMVTLVKSGLLEGAKASARIEQALRDLLAFARTNAPHVQTLRLVCMEWSDFRAPSSDFRHPERCQVITEVTHS